ncbi:Uma2 family endonuclease [Thiobaca trueperi]|uniref:Uma2 family endonuclease n=1 Tax=Thiobaca trueperi TaxID=127458 RepID=A0A4R3N4Y3_9GAMM|nr:Uma2 family endonuclease [Thiobaca trueperi]TCT23834.1 Uma2 family endonuclease [Thiobaca trueperi]
MTDPAHSHVQTQRFTYADYCTWPDDQRYELIEGIPYAMAPAPVIAHQQVVLRIAAQAQNALKGKPCQPFVAPVDVLFPQTSESGNQSHTVLQPDVFVICDPSKIERQAIRGAPDWVVEVLSPATASRDHIVKRRIYETAGVREYWLVHPEDRILMIYRLENGVYGKPDVQALTGETPVGILPEILIQWDEPE